MNRPGFGPVLGRDNECVAKEEAEEEVRRISRENMRLVGEIAILRQNMIALEKQNFTLREEKSQAVLSELRRMERLKKEVDVLRVESKINDNQSRAFKRQKAEAEMDVKWALSKGNSGVSFSLLPFELKRLKFLKDFFYPDFCQLDSASVIREMSKRISRFKEFLDLYILFSCKADVFKEFFCMVLVNPLFPEEKVRLFNAAPLDWILNFNDERFISVVKEYVDRNFRQMGLFLLRVVKERPFLLNILITREMFTKLAEIESKATRGLVSEVCKKGGLSLVDYTNMHYISQRDLKALYKNLYFEVPF